MLDLLAIVVIFALFAVSLIYLHGCNSLKGGR